MRLITHILALAMVATLVSACTLLLDPALLDADLEPELTPMVLRTADEVPRISVEEAKQHFDAGTAVFIDSRSEREYLGSHIEGAISFVSLPPWSDEDVPLASKLDEQLLVITYCT
jgi:hypothetical protein